MRFQAFRNGRTVLRNQAVPWAGRTPILGSRKEPAMTLGLSLMTLGFAVVMAIPLFGPLLMAAL
jgi:hypothetical protein